LDTHRIQIAMPVRVDIYGLEDLCEAACDGDLDKLNLMLNYDDPINGFHGDLNYHCSEMNALHLAARNGQTECVEALLTAGADPHVKTRVPLGRDPRDGKTGRTMAEEQGWEDISDLLKAAEKKTPVGDYMMYGAYNNMKLYPPETILGREPRVVREMQQKQKELLKGKGYVPEKLSGSALLFPGFGSQYAKMLSGDVKQLPAVKDLLATAKRVLGWDPASVSAAKLEELDVCLPMVFVADIAALEKLRVEKPDAVARPSAVAGMGIGEVAALVAAGVLPFEDGIKIVKVSADALAKASGKQPAQAMLSVAGIKVAKLEVLCTQVREDLGQDCVCEVANVLFPRGATCAGHQNAMEKLEKLAKENGAVQAKLTKGCGALNTKLMKEAADAVEDALREAAPRMSPPKCAIYFNCTGKPTGAGLNPKMLIHQVVKGMTQPVLWEASMTAMTASGVSSCYEVGPMENLKATMKRISAGMWEKTEGVDV